MILITGIGGFIGRRMAEIFRERKIDFVGIDYKESSYVPKENFIKLDVRDSKLADIIREKKVDSIIHMAFVTAPKIDPNIRKDIDINGSKNIIESAVKNGIKDIVFISSERVYGDQKAEGGVIDKDGNYLNPLDDIYAKDKIEAENLFLDASEKNGFNLSILRLAIVCIKGGGPGLGDMINSASKTGRYMKLRGKNPPIQLIHCDDVVDAAYNALGKNGIFDIGAEDKITLTEIFEYAAQLGGKKPSPINLPEKPTYYLVKFLWNIGLSPIPPLYVRMLGYDFFRDVSKTVETLGKPKYSSKEIIENIVS
ncbi:MAG: NAD(P)-dependent oxidoreductase [Candidatus Schekmanbacteria bacterium]|nr:MAG: NAD(P)-dependent oxidoreductase [Candidatus Schekmanbacteria bacterium]